MFLCAVLFKYRATPRCLQPPLHFTSLCKKKETKNHKKKIPDHNLNLRRLWDTSFPDCDCRCLAPMCGCVWKWTNRKSEVWGFIHWQINDWAVYSSERWVRANTLRYIRFGTDGQAWHPSQVALIQHMGGWSDQQVTWESFGIWHDFTDNRLLSASVFFCILAAQQNFQRFPFRCFLTYYLKTL